MVGDPALTMRAPFGSASRLKVKARSHALTELQTPAPVACLPQHLFTEAEQLCCGSVPISIHRSSSTEVEAARGEGSPFDVVPHVAFYDQTKGSLVCGNNICLELAKQMG